MLAGYFDGIPRDLDEAAKVDGSGPMGALWHVVLPAARPGLIAVAIYSFMTSWGEVLFASVMTTDENRTLAVGLQLYSTQTNVYWNQIMAASLVVSHADRGRVPAAAAQLRRRADGRRGEVTGAPAASVSRSRSL